MQPSLGEFEELALLMVAALSYGVAILENLEKKLKKKANISAIHVALNRLENKGLLQSSYGEITSKRGGRRKKFTPLQIPVKRSSTGDISCKPAFTSRYQIALSIEKPANILCIKVCTCVFVLYEITWP